MKKIKVINTPLLSASGSAFDIRQEWYGFAVTSEGVVELDELDDVPVDAVALYEKNNGVVTLQVLTNNLLLEKTLELIENPLPEMFVNDFDLGQGYMTVLEDELSVCDDTRFILIKNNNEYKLIDANDYRNQKVYGKIDLTDIVEVYGIIQ